MILVGYLLCVLFGRGNEGIRSEDVGFILVVFVNIRLR